MRPTTFPGASRLGPHAVTRYFAAVFAASAVFWSAGFADIEPLLPGVPFSALMFLTPAAIAWVLVRRSAGREAARSWLREAVSLQPIRRAALLLIALSLPAVSMWMSWSLMTATGRELPDSDLSPDRAALLLALFLLPALCEELGWCGLAYPLLRRRYSMVAAGSILGVLWAVWHYVPLHQMDRAPTWIAWWTVGTVVLRLLISWTYERGGGVVLAALMHASANASWQCFPRAGSHYDPAWHAVVLVVVASSWLAGMGDALAPGSRRSNAA